MLKKFNISPVLSLIICLIFIVNIGWIPIKMKAADESNSEIYINFSLRSPQEVGEEIEISCSGNNMLQGEYSYYIKDLGGEYRVLEEKTNENKIKWIPEKDGIYIIKAIFREDNRLLMAEKAYEVTNDRKAEIISSEIKDGDILELARKYYFKVNMPSETDGEEYICKAYYNNFSISNIDNFVSTKSNEAGFAINTIDLTLMADSYYGCIRVELYNLTKERIDDIKEYNVKLDWAGIRNKLLIEKNSNYKSINLSFIPQLNGLENANYSFYCMELETGEKHPISENIKNPQVNFVLDKKGKYILSGEVEYKDFKSKALYEMIEVTDEGIVLLNKEEAEYEDLIIKYNCNKNYIYEGRLIGIDSIVIGNKSNYNKKIYVKSPDESEYNLISNSYIPVKSGEYKVKAEIEYKDKTYIVEDSFYAKKVPKYNNIMKLNKVDVIDVFSKNSKLKINKNFYTEFNIIEDNYSKGTNKDCIVTLVNENGNIIESRKGSSKSNSFYMGRFKVDKKGEYKLIIEVKNTDIKNSVAIEESYPLKIEDNSIDGMDLVANKKEGIVLEKLELAALFEKANEENCKFSFYQKRIDENEYKPIIERTTSSVVDFLPEVAGEYEFKFVIHESMKDYVFQNKHIIVSYKKEDIDKDSKVTMKDLALIANKYNNTISSIGWNSEYDLNSDSIVDIYDLIIVSKSINSYELL